MPTSARIADAVLWPVSCPQWPSPVPNCPGVTHRVTTLHGVEQLDRGTETTAMHDYAFSLRVDDEADAKGFVAGLPPEIRTQISLSSRRGLGGDLPQWIILGTAATATLKTILTAALKYVELTRIKSIRVGTIEVENPRPQDVERILDELTAKGQLAERADGGEGDDGK